MRTITHNGNRLELYDSIEEMPITRFMGFNRSIMIDSGIGSDFQAFSAKVQTILGFIANEQLEKASAELNNMQALFHMMISKTNPGFCSFAWLIKMINGELVTDMTDEKAGEIIHTLGKKGLTVGKIRGVIHDVKKNWRQNWRSIFQAKRTTQPRQNIYQESSDGQS